MPSESAHATGISECSACRTAQPACAANVRTQRKAHTNCKYRSPLLPSGKPGSNGQQTPWTAPTAWAAAQAGSSSSALLVVSASSSQEREHAPQEHGNRARNQVDNQNEQEGDDNPGYDVLRKAAQVWAASFAPHSPSGGQGTTR